MDEKTKKEIEDILNPDDFDEPDDSELDDDKSKEDDEGESKATNEDNEESVNSSKDKLEEERIKAKNSEFAQRRREKEKHEREALEKEIRKDAKLEAQLEANKTNTFTDTPIKDEQDLKVFKLMQKIDEEGGDPISDLPSAIAEEERKKVRALKEESKKNEENKKKLESEASELRKAYPDLDLVALSKNESFIQKCVEKGGRWTMLEIYESIKKDEVYEKAKKRKEKVSEEVDKTAEKMSKTPSSSKKGSTITKTVSEMSDEEFEEYWKHKYNN